MKHGSLTILLVEDEEHDIFCLQQATEKAGPAHTLNAAHDGAEAVCYLQGQGQFADRQQYPLPNLILTDLKMPGMDGFEFLQCLREHPDYQSFQWSFIAVRPWKRMCERLIVWEPTPTWSSPPASSNWWSYSAPLTSTGPGASARPCPQREPSKTRRSILALLKQHRLEYDERYLWD
ncbi:MAG TPA: response regulator [Bacillota bacterium]|nr:response regulator [Bacillota bacterium]